MVLAGFGTLITILLIAVIGAVFTVRHYQSTTAEMQARANIASELQVAQAQGGNAALLIQRYVVAGDPYLITDIQSSAATATSALARAAQLQREATPEDAATVNAMNEVAARGQSLTAGALEILQLRQANELDRASALLEEIAPIFREQRLQLDELTNNQVRTVNDLQARSDSAGNLAMTLLVLSGVIGVLLAIMVATLVSRAIMRPLSRLEGTALAVALGDMKARAPVYGPRELKRLAESLNLMTATARQRTEELRLSNEELRQRNRQLLDARYQAATDPLTGLLNHRSFHESLREEVAQRLRDGGQASVIMIDIDNFKRVNDSLGHMAGDHVLRTIAATICDVVGDQHAHRYGGDEFAILLPGVGRGEAFSIADRLLKAVKTRVKSEDGSKATVSLGVASFPDMASSAEELLYRSDMALNWAKSKGKNRIGGWDQVIEEERSFTGVPHIALREG
jgi:diguanylate cyclase (GGDEF)-like protein